MRIYELILEKNRIKYQIKSLNSRLDEINQSCMPSPNTEGNITSRNNTSPQEIILIQAEAVLEKIKDLVMRQTQIEDMIEKELDVIENPIHKWIVRERLWGKSWKEMDFGYSQSYMRKIFKDSMNLIEKKSFRRNRNE